MEAQIIKIYCIVEEFLKGINFKDDSQALLTSAEILTISITACQFFGGNQSLAMDFFSEHKYVKNRLSKSQFNRRLHKIPLSTIQALFYELAEIFKKRNTSKEYSVDSYPIPVCKNARINRSKIYPKNESYRGFKATNNSYFYGLKAHLICTAQGEPVELLFAPGSYHDLTVFKEMNFDFEEYSKIYGDKAYNDIDFEQFMKEALNIDILPIRKDNMLEQHEPYISNIIQRVRKSIETAFSSITSKFLTKIHAVTAKGFELKNFLFVLAYAIRKF